MNAKYFGKKGWTPDRIGNLSGKTYVITGANAGAGFEDLGTVRFVLGVNYRYGLHNIVDVKTRYNDSFLTSGVYDVTDNIELRNIEIYLGCQFTLKYKDF